MTGTAGTLDALAPGGDRFPLPAALRRAPRGFRWLFIVATTSLVLAAFYTAFLFVQQQNTLRDVSRYNLTWLLSQAAVEVARLDKMVGGAFVPGAGVDQEKVHLWFDIVQNRVRLLDRGEAREFINSDPGLIEIARNFKTTVNDIQPMLDQLDQPGVAREVFNRLDKLSPQLMRLAAAANVHSGDLTAEDLVHLSRLHWIFTGILAGLGIFSLALIAVLSWHNRLLSRAHREVNALVVDLQRTSLELTGANSRVQQAIEEVRLQNNILTERDFELSLQNTRFDAALNNMSQALCMVDGDQRLIVCNDRFMELFGLSPGVVRPGTRISDVFRAAGAVGKYKLELLEAIAEEQQTMIVAHSPGGFLKEMPDECAMAVSHQPMIRGGWVATYEDVTERRRTETRIDFMAHHDALTSLPNRAMFRERLDAALKEPRRKDESLAVLLLDLDYFKDVNDTLGYPAGDQLLEAVAQRLRLCAGEDNVVARIGGDEFAVLQRCTDYPTQAEALARKILETLAQPYVLEGLRGGISVSIGIATANDRLANPDIPLKSADMALFRAKGDGRGTFRFFAAEMDAQMQARRAIEQDLREALNRDEFEVYYQPIFDLSTDQVTGFEALLRWIHPERGMVSPVQFVPLAEELGLIVPIGEWVLRQACKDAANWPAHLKVAINLSPVQFGSDNLVEIVEAALWVSGLPGNRVELEITESALLQENDRVLITLRRLRALGVRTALDDFGTGYSSLSYLRSFPFDKIKIDQSFVREMATRPDSLAIVHSVSALARQLGIITTAEGVETGEQLRQVRAAGCAEAQGYYFDSPQPLASIRRWFTPAPARVPMA